MTRTQARGGPRRACESGVHWSRSDPMPQLALDDLDGGVLLWTVGLCGAALRATSIASALAPRTV